MFYFISAPLVFFTIPFAPFFEWRKHKLSPMLLLWLVAFGANLLLFFNYSTTINWRYFLTGLPGLVPLGACWLLLVAKKLLRTEHRAFVACNVVILVFATIFFILVRPVSY